MTGHHIYTRSWYAFGSRSRSPGTYTVELTDGLFPPGTDDVIHQKLNPVFSGTQPSIAGYSMERSLLRVFHPTTDSSVVSRSYFTNDEITGRGVVQYSFGLVFTKEASDQFLRFPRRAFEPSAFEPYGELVGRVAEDGTLAYSGAYDPKPADYGSPIVVPRDKWAGFGFDRDSFVDFFVSLGKAITAQKSEQKTAVLLPAGANGEELMLAVLSVLPQWLRRKFGAASRWAGAMEGGNAAAIAGMQLVCYVGEKPPYDAEAAIIDLAGGSNRNIEPVTDEQRELAQWYWDNIDDPGALSEMEGYLLKQYKQLMDRMPFAIFAHCFWLWLTFTKNYRFGDSLSFETASRAIESLASAFGRKLNDYFENKVMLLSIANCFSTDLAKVGASEVKAATVRAICVLAGSDVKLGSILMRDLAQPLYEKLFAAGQWGKLEPILQYYSKVLGDEGPAERVPEARASFERLLVCPDRACADEAGAALSRYANACIAAALTRSEKSRIEDYKAIAILLKNTGRQINIDISSIGNLPDSEEATKAFYAIEKYNREVIANVRPPGNKQLEYVLGRLHLLAPDDERSALRELLAIYWRAEELKDKAQQRKYVNYLSENRKIHLFVENDVGIDDIRGIYEDELNTAFDGREFDSVDDRIAELLKWSRALRDECGFRATDPIFDCYNAKLRKLSSVKGLCESMSPDAGKQLSEILRQSTLRSQKEVVALLCKLDDIAESRDEVSKVLKEFEAIPDIFLARMDYWIRRAGSPPPEWALSIAVFKTGLDSMPMGGPTGLADLYLAFMGEERDTRRDLADLYEALRMTCNNRGYDHIRQDIFLSVERKIYEIVSQPSVNIDDVVYTADDFKGLLQEYKLSGYGGYERLLALGQEICQRVSLACSERGKSEPSDEQLRKFDPSWGWAMDQRTDSDGAGSKLYIVSFAVLMLGTACCAYLFAAGGGALALLEALPVWQLAVMAAAALAVFAFALVGASRMFSFGGRRR